MSERLPGAKDRASMLQASCDRNLRSEPTWFYGASQEHYLFAFAFAALVLMFTTASAIAQDFGTAEQARAMLDRAVAVLKSDEPKALREFSDPDNKEFHDRDLYVSCFNISDGNFTAAPPGMLGMDIRTFKVGDDPIGQKVFDAIQGTPQGSIVTMDFNFPKTGKPAVKQSLETRIGDQGCAVSYYR